jgi:hypothetical protein
MRFSKKYDYYLLRKKVIGKQSMFECSYTYLENIRIVIVVKRQVLERGPMWKPDARLLLVACMVQMELPPVFPSFHVLFCPDECQFHISDL